MSLALRYFGEKAGVLPAGAMNLRCRGSQWAYPGLGLPRFGGQFTVWVSMTGSDLHTGTITTVPRKRVASRGIDTSYAASAAASKAAGLR